MSSPTTHQQYQPVPQLDVPLVDSNGIVNSGWYRFLIDLWTQVGGGTNVGSSLATVLKQAVAGEATVSAVDVQSSAVLGTLQLSTSRGDPAQVQKVGLTPFLFVAPKVGTLIVSGGSAEISRDVGTTFLLVSLSGGAIPVQVGDQVRVAWVGPPDAKVTFLPID